MTTLRLLTIMMLATSVLAFAPTAEASPPTCYQGDYSDHALINYVSCTRRCLDSANWGNGFCPDPRAELPRD